MNTMSNTFALAIIDALPGIVHMIPADATPGPDMTHNRALKLARMMRDEAVRNGHITEKEINLQMVATILRSTLREAA